MGTLTPPRRGGTFGRHSASLHVAESGRGRVPAAPLISRNAGGARPGPGAGGASLRVPPHGEGPPRPWGCGGARAGTQTPAPDPGTQSPVPPPQPRPLRAPDAQAPPWEAWGPSPPQCRAAFPGSCPATGPAPRPAGRAQPRPARGRPRPAPSGARAAAATNLLFHPPAQIPARRRLTTNCTIDCLNIFHLDKISLG